MRTYIGTKQIQAKPMNRLDYNNYRGWELPADEDGSDEGYLVEYMDGGQANHPNHEGYISWSPKEVFERTYFLVGNLSAYEPWEQRIVCERTELEKRMRKLTGYIRSDHFKQLSDDHRVWLRLQHDAMSRYLGILYLRVDLP